MLHFSLDSPDEDEHNRLEKVNCYSHVFKSLEIAKSLVSSLTILFTVTDETYLKTSRMHEIASKAGTAAK